MNKRILIFAALMTSLTACGSTPFDRGTSGAGLGAATGAVLGAITGGPVGTAAALGAASGALAGALTTKDQVDLGDPPWRHTAAARSSGRIDSSPKTVAWIQSRLNTLGYKAGPVDGRAGPQTRDAIRAYERDHDMPANGIATYELADTMWRNGS